jgi:hypothetical protein
MKPSFSFLFFILIFFLMHCERSMEPSQNEILLQYEFMHGWTGAKSSINIFENKEMKYVDETEIEISFSESEKNELESFLINFTDYKNKYQPSNGTYMDIDFHWLVHYPESKADSISIYIPLDSNQIPSELRNVIKIMSSKF